ncbi:hypothetical protein V8D89_010039 [Ganoderma adspersum]
MPSSPAQSPNGASSHATDSNRATGVVKAPTTSGTGSPGPVPDAPSQGPVVASRSQETLRQSIGDAAMSRSESEPRDSESGRSLDPTAPDISSTIAEFSLVLDGSASGTPTNVDTALALARPRAVVAHALDSKPDSESTRVADVPLQTPGPERSARDAATVAGGEDSVQTRRVGARVRRLPIDDGGVGLAGGGGWVIMRRDGRSSRSGTESGKYLRHPTRNIEERITGDGDRVAVRDSDAARRLPYNAVFSVIRFSLERRWWTHLLTCGTRPLSLGSPDHSPRAAHTSELRVFSGAYVADSRVYVREAISGEIVTARSESMKHTVTAASMADLSLVALPLTSFD